MENQCTATAKSTGERCQRPAIKGGNVCYQHGGAADQVQKKAQERLDEMADSTTATIQKQIGDLESEYQSTEDTDEKLDIMSEMRRLWKIILDRTGHGQTEKKELEHSGEVSGSLFDLPDEVTDNWERTDGDGE